MPELEAAIRSLRTIAEGPDRIRNEMIKHLTGNAGLALVAAFNNVWHTGQFPAAW